MFHLSRVARCVGRNVESRVVVCRHRSEVGVLRVAARGRFRFRPVRPALVLEASCCAAVKEHRIESMVDHRARAASSACWAAALRSSSTTAVVGRSLARVNPFEA